MPACKRAESGVRGPEPRDASMRGAESGVWAPEPRDAGNLPAPHWLYPTWPISISLTVMEFQQFVQSVSDRLAPQRWSRSSLQGCPVERAGSACWQQQEGKATLIESQKACASPGDGPSLCLYRNSSAALKVSPAPVWPSELTCKHGIKARVCLLALISAEVWPSCVLCPPGSLDKAVVGPRARLGNSAKSFATDSGRLRLYCEHQAGQSV